MRAGGLYGSSAETRVNAMRTTRAGSTSFTSTVMAQAGGANARAVEAVVRNPKKKGYARVKTSGGDLNLELHCDVAPRTCENFIALARAGYYDGGAFHRSVKNFMVQGGHPTGTGRGGQSVWGGTFRDEITHLKHSGRGVVSMANSGAHTNGSQFFVCYKSAAHLDGKHSVFGAVVGGMETLAKMERVPTDADDRPSPSGAIVIESVEVFVDPYEDAAREEAEAAEKKREDEAGTSASAWRRSTPAGGGPTPRAAARAADDAPGRRPKWRRRGEVHPRRAETEAPGSSHGCRRRQESQVLRGVGTGTLTRGDAAVAGEAFLLRPSRVSVRIKTVVGFFLQ